jgi:signal transduction histidine kinase/streptogramin lyase
MAFGPVQATRPLYFKQKGIPLGSRGNSRIFRHLRHINNNPQSISNPLVRALCEDRNGTLWVGTGGGLDSYDPRTGHFEHYRNRQGKANSLSSDLVMTLVEDRDGKLWVGTDGGGLNLFDRRTRTFKVFRSDPRDPSTIGSDYIMTLCEGRDGTLWIGTTGGGLTRMNRQTHVCQRYRRTRDAPDQISGNYIYAIHEDPDGRIWLGTWGAGITVLDPKTNQVRVYRHDPAQPTSLSNNTIHAFHRGAAGSLWIATMGGGLECYDVVSGGFTHITDQDGLPNNVLYRIEEDSTGRLWISTNSGISCYDSQNRTFRNYGLSDGVQSLEFNQGASCKGPDGTLYFGGINGVNSITPERLATTHRVPPVAITQVKVMDREVKVPGSVRDVLELDHDENFLSFMFSVLDFTAPEQNTCRYMLEGLDKGWINAGTRRYAAYTDLQPGEYLLRVQGRSSDGEWNREGSAARIRVRPPFWGTLWFRAMALAAILGMGFGFYRDRMQRLQKERTAQAEFSRKLNEFQENERKRIAGELHDSLGQDLLTIRNRLAVCEAMPPQGDAIQHEIRDIAGSVQQTIEEVREISADLHPHMLDRLGLTRTIESTVKKCAASSGIKMEATVDNVDHLFTPVEEINVFRIVQEGLNNVVKHSRASECTVTLLKHAATCELVLADDGCGFVPAQPLVAHESDGGFGLMHMAERVRLLHGSMEIASSPGNGTTLRISLPLSHHSPTGTS